MTGLPCTMTFVETDAPGTGITVDVVHGLEAGEGGTGHVVGFPEMSPAQTAGDPPIMTFVCFGKTTTGPAWQQVITAEVLTIGGTGLSLANAARSIPGVVPHGNRPQLPRQTGRYERPGRASAHSRAVSSRPAIVQACCFQACGERASRTPLVLAGSGYRWGAVGAHRGRHVRVGLDHHR